MTVAESRREFLQRLGGGLVVLVAVDDIEAQESGGTRRRGGRTAAPKDIGAWLHIGEDGLVEVFTGKAEVGQNTRTSLTQAVADELRVAVSAVHLTMADTDLVPYDIGTFGSLSTPQMAPQLRKAAASAREMLIRLAAEKWNLKPSAVQAADGAVSELNGSRRAGYGELTRGQKLVETIGDGARVTPPGEWKVAGKSIPKVGGRAFVTGQHKYASDLSVPGMLHGKVIRPASFGARLVSVDTGAADSIPGVKSVRDGDFIGIAAPDPRTAESAAAAVKSEWKADPQQGNQGLFAYLKQTAGPEQVVKSAGSVESSYAAAPVKLRESYQVAYIAHTPLEPRAALAQWSGDKLTVWTGTQRPFGVRSELAEAFKIPEEQVRVIVPDTGSGYGGKHTGEAAIEAARLSRASGKPVKLVWTRTEEFTWAYARPAALIEIASAAGGDGLITSWEFHNYNSGTPGIETLYTMANRRIVFHPSKSPLRQGSYRALGSTANHFARESHIDELAGAVKMDPLQFRLKNLADERMKAVLSSAAEKFGWGRKPAAGNGFGIAGGFEKNGYVATAAEVTREGNAIKVIRLVTAFDCGAVVNPRHLENQVEGAIVQGLGGALFEALTFENGRITNARLGAYRVPRFGDVPVLETVLLDRKDVPSAGAGESPLVALAPAIANAAFQATGIRLRSMPLRFVS